MLGLPDGGLQAADGQRVFRAHVDVTLRRAYGVTGNGHAFQYAMGIAFEHAAIHERPRIAFISVADDKFALALGLGHRGPFEAGGVTRAAASPQTAFDHPIDDFHGLHLQQHLMQSLIAVGRDVSFDAFGIDHAAVFEHNRHLLREERMVRVTFLGGRLAAF